MDQCGGKELNDLPASYHNRCSALAFADGHAELHRWQDARTVTATASGPQPDNQDAVWLTTHATVPK